MKQAMLTGFWQKTCRWLMLAGVLLGWLASLQGHAEESRLGSIGIVVADLGNPFFVQIIESATQRAEELAGKPVTMLVRSDAYDLNRQKQLIDEFIAEGVDLILLTAADMEGIAPSVAKAQRSGIRVVAVDVNARGADATITTDNVLAGELSCEYLARKMNYQGNLVIINGVAVSSVVERVAGCKSVINNYPDIHMLSDRLNGNGSFGGGMEAMTYLMEAYPEIHGVFSINDPTAQGAMQAARQAGRTDFAIASVDGAPFAVDVIRSSQSIWVATAQQKPSVMGRTAVEMGLRLLQGDTIENSFILIPPVLISKESPRPLTSW